jgi:hypothetical protein
MPQKGSNLHRKENRFLEMCKHKLIICQPLFSESLAQAGFIKPPRLSKSVRSSADTFRNLRLASSAILRMICQKIFDASFGGLCHDGSEVLGFFFERDSATARTEATSR